MTHSLSHADTMKNKHMGIVGPPQSGATTLVSPEIPVPGGTVHATDVITPRGDVTNSHLTFTPTGGGRKTSVWESQGTGR